MLMSTEIYTARVMHLAADFTCCHETFARQRYAIFPESMSLVRQKRQTSKCKLDGNDTTISTMWVDDKP